jgi:Notch-like protein
MSNLNDFHYFSGVASLTSPSQCSIQSPQSHASHVQSPLHNQTQPQQYYHMQHNQLATAASSNSFYQYLTPPSHNDSGNQTPPQHLVQTLDSYPTPSPESPGNWSSSPHSMSDWSEVNSPANPQHFPTNPHQSNKGSEAIYI